MLNKIDVISKILLLLVFLCAFLSLAFLFHVTFFFRSTCLLPLTFFFPPFSAPLNLLLSLSFPSESQTSRPNKTVLITAQLIHCPSLYTRSYHLTPPRPAAPRQKETEINNLLYSRAFFIGKFATWKFHARLRIIKNNQSYPMLPNFYPYLFSLF